MNYVYGVEFVEVDPLWELGLEQVNLVDVVSNSGCNRIYK